MTLPMIWGPTFEEMLHPAKIDKDVRKRAIEAKKTAPLDPVNLFNISWTDANGAPYSMVLPKELTGVDANIVVLYGRDFPTGSHKVGATYSVSMEMQLLGMMRPGEHVAVFPSTGNYGIGGAWVGPRLGYETVVILPELMSKERFEKIAAYGASYIKTPGCESSVKEIYDKCKELARDEKVRILNQFEMMANYRFHYYCTGNTVAELMTSLKTTGTGNGRCAAFVSSMGSAGTIAAGDRLKQVFPECKIVGLEPIQCPTLYNNGYGDHDIQGIGDKHVTWIHNVMNMDALMCIDDMECKLMLQVLSTPVGIEYLARDAGVPEEAAKKLYGLFGISGVCNMLGAIKTAKHYRMGPDETVVTMLTDAFDRYPSVMDQLDERFGKLDKAAAHARFYGIVQQAKLDYIQEGTMENRDRWLNLKYYTWVEQHGKTVQELNAQKSQSWWRDQQALVPERDSRLAKIRAGK